MRHEDHVGHKVEWENDVQMHLDGIADEVLNIRCDIMTKLHQGTHSKDAFTNNLHELVYHIKCTDGTEMHVTTMNPIGTPGSSPGPATAPASWSAPPTPANSPSGGGQRVIPDRTCVNRFVLVPRDRTPASPTAFTRAGRPTLRSGPRTARPWPRSIPTTRSTCRAGSTIPAWRTSPAAPSASATRSSPTATGPTARRATPPPATARITGLVQTDPRSPFNGVSRFVDINGNRVDNADGPNVWLHRSVREARADHDVSREHPAGRSPGPTTARCRSMVRGSASDRNYGGPGVHAPN